VEFVTSWRNEVVFVVAAALFLGIAAPSGSFQDAASYVEGLNFTEPKFVLVVMVVAATRPVVSLAEWLISWAARILPLRESVSFYLAALFLGPLLGSLITEPAAMTLLALVLKRRYFNRGITPRLAYATLGLLFVNVSIGGTLTTSPPRPCDGMAMAVDSTFMLTHFGWRATASCAPDDRGGVPLRRNFRSSLSNAHTGRAFHRGSRHPPRFLGLVVALRTIRRLFESRSVPRIASATAEYQDSLKLRRPARRLLSGGVGHAAAAGLRLKPLIQGLSGGALFFGATGLTAITDNAALTYLGSLVEGISDELKYALVAGAVTGGGLTVIANAPNPAGVGILQDAKVFEDEGISPLCLFLGALMPTAVAIVFFWLVR
jgi:hypothetical protein